MRRQVGVQVRVGVRHTFQLQLCLDLRRQNPHGEDATSRGLSPLEDPPPEGVSSPGEPSPLPPPQGPPPTVLGTPGATTGSLAALDRTRAGESAQIPDAVASERLQLVPPPLQTPG